MTAVDTTAGRRLPAGATSDAALVLAAALLFLAVSTASGFPTLADARGDNDSLLRLVQVRDLLAGQAWFDPVQTRMGPEGGFAMHWSRLVDLPIVALILAASLFGAQPAAAEAIAMVAWPLGLFLGCVWMIIRMARHVAGEWAALPAVVVGAGSLYYVNIFAPGALDHHNVQLALALGCVMLLVEGREGWRKAAGAGVCAALMLAVGMETAPYVAVAGGFAALAFLVEGRRAAPLAAGFGAAFGLATMAAFLATVPARDWLAAQCDALSSVQLSVAALGGFGLAAVALVPSAGSGFARRLVALALVGGAVAALVLIAFPHCLADPYADLDPRLRRYWLSAVTEAQSIFGVWASGDRRMLAANYATPLVALAVLLWRQARGTAGRAEALLGAFLLAAVLVSLWQVRGSMFSVPFAAIVLAGWVGSLRAAAGREAPPAAQLAMAGAWLVSFNIVWSAAAGLVTAPSAAKASPASAAPGTPASQCYHRDDYATLAALPAGTVLAISNMGAPILAHTGHRAFAGPYHRNVAGNLTTLDMLMGPPGAARERLASAGADYVVLCRGNGETRVMGHWAPDGFLAALVAGESFAWLEPVAGTSGTAVEIHRVAGR